MLPKGNVMGNVNWSVEKAKLSMQGGSRAALLCIALLALGALPTVAYAEFIVSAKDSCFGYAGGKTIYKYWFGINASADLKVWVGDYLPIADIKMKVVEDPRQADLIVVDEFDGADMFVCNQISASNKSVWVGIIASADIKISRVSYGEDYSIYINSRVFSEDEAIALIPAIWHFNKK